MTRQELDDACYERAARKVAAMGPNEFEWAANVIRDLKSNGKQSGPTSDEAMERAELKYHAIQSAALNEIKEIINTRTVDWDDRDDVARLLSDIETVAAFASEIDLTNPHYDGYALVEAVEYDPNMDILSHARQIVADLPEET